MVAPMRAAWDVNCNGTRRLLTACREQGVARFVQLSSVAAFGFDFPANVDESHPLITNGNSYVDTKITSEHTVLAAHAGGEIDCTIIRPGDVYGPASRAWVIVPLEMMRAGQFLLPDAGQGVFSPVYIDDLVDGIVLAAGKPEGAGQIFTLTSGVGVSCAEFFGHHWRWLGKQARPGPCRRALRLRWRKPAPASRACWDASRNSAAARSSCSGGPPPTVSRKPGDFSGTRPRWTSPRACAAPRRGRARRACSVPKP